MAFRKEEYKTTLIAGNTAISDNTDTIINKVTHSKPSMTESPSVTAAAVPRVLGLAIEHGFEVSGKVTHIDLLSQLGDDADAEYHKNHTEVTKENYFILSKLSVDLKSTKNIENVPTVNLRLPHQNHLRIC